MILVPFRRGEEKERVEEMIRDFFGFALVIRNEERENGAGVVRLSLSVSFSKVDWRPLAA